MKTSLKMTKKDKEASESGINPSSNGQYIVMLTEAEKKAREIVEAAKKRKANMLKKAREDSANEIDEFKREREGLLRSLQAEHTNNKDMSAVQFQRELESKKGELKASYNDNARKTLELILNNLTQVDAKCHENLKI